jgi:hypothetical protein
MGHWDIGALFSTRYIGTWYMAHGTWYMVRGTFGTWHMAHAHAHASLLPSEVALTLAPKADSTCYPPPLCSFRLMRSGGLGVRPNDLD